MSIKIYSLTSIGERLSHSYRYKRSPEWAVIHFLNRNGGQATQEQIYENVPSASASTLANLAIKRIIIGGRTVGF